MSQFSLSKVGMPLKRKIDSQLATLETDITLLLLEKQHWVDKVLFRLIPFALLETSTKMSKDDTWIAVKKREVISFCMLLLRRD